jgi:hypothetical protein
MSSRFALTFAALTCACANRTTPPADEPTDADRHAGTDDWTQPTEPLERDDPGTSSIEPTPAGTIAWQHVDLVTGRGPGWLLGQLGPEPYRPRGRFEGWRITAVFPDAPELCDGGCDLQPGDVILAVEGDKLETPTAYSAMFERAPTLAALRVVRVRGGVREDITYRITPRPLPATPAPG